MHVMSLSMIRRYSPPPALLRVPPLRARPGAHSCTSRIAKRQVAYAVPVRFPVAVSLSRDASKARHGRPRLPRCLDTRVVDALQPLWLSNIALENGQAETLVGA